MERPNNWNRIIDPHGNRRFGTCYRIPVPPMDPTLKVKAPEPPPLKPVNPDAEEGLVSFFIDGGL